MFKGSWSDIIAAITYFIGTLFSRPEDIKQNSMNNEPGPIADQQTTTPAPKYLWDTKENCRHSVRVICDEEGLSLKQKNDLSATVHCESNYNPKCIHPNVVNGKTTSTDYGICQVNDYYHIGPNKTFPSVDYVLNNPEACIRWMAKQFKFGKGYLWVCYGKNMYQNYSS